MYSLIGNKITSKGAAYLFKYIIDTKLSIKVLFLNRNMINDDCVEVMGFFIQNCHSLTEIDLSDNKLTDNAIQLLSKYLNGNTTLEIIGLQNLEEITDHSKPYFLDLIQTSHIQKIDIYRTPITDPKFLIAPLAESILKNKIEKMEFAGK